MGDGTRENPYTREDVLKAIKKNGDTAEGLDLSERTFEEGIDLSNLPLGGIILVNAHLERANLMDAHLEGALLWNAHLEGTRLTDAHLGGADLSHAHLEGADLRNAHLEGAHLRDAHLEGAHLIDAHLEGAHLIGAHLEEAYLMGVHLEGAYLYRAKFSSDTRLADADWGNYMLGEEEKGDQEKDKVWFGIAEETYRRLKTWHTEHGVYDIAGEFLFREMEAKRKSLSWLQPQERRWLGRWPLRGQKVRLNVYKWLFGYGERPWRVVVWGLLVLFGLALVYFLLRGVAPYTLTVQAFLSSLYYSAVSFTALGYGPWFSSSSVRPWVQGVGAVEAIIGVFTIALFLITFVRKMTR